MLSKPRHNPVSADSRHSCLCLSSAAASLRLPSAWAFQISRWWDPAGTLQAKESRQSSSQSLCPSWEWYVSINSTWRPAGSKLALLISLEATVKAQARDVGATVTDPFSLLLRGPRTYSEAGQRKWPGLRMVSMQDIWNNPARCGHRAQMRWLLLPCWPLGKRWMEGPSVESHTPALSPLHPNLPRYRISRACPNK